MYLMLDIYNNYPYQQEPDEMKGLSDKERAKVARWTIVGYMVSIAIGLLVCWLMGSCTTPRAVEEHHHHHYEADTMAVKAQVDRQLSSWHEENEAWLHQAFSEQSASWFSNEHQQEMITEMITVTTDSLGREVRQEQRTISRDITRELQQQEQRLTREMQAQLRVVVDSVNDAWQQRFDSLSSHLTSDISHQASSTPVGDARPWYQRVRDKLLWLAAGACFLAFGVWMTRKWWLKLLKKQV